MQRIAILVSSLLLGACAASRTSALLVGDAPEVRVDAANAGALDASLAATVPVEPARATEALPLALVSVPAEGESLHGSRFTLKGGYYGSSEDALDDGYIFNVSWMKFLSKILALELEVGYLDADGEDGTEEAELWSVPIMLNGRLNVPIWILDLYGGVGIGTLYYDVEASDGILSASDDGFLLGGNGFLGATINLADRIALGLEGKYYVTEDIDDFDEGLDAFALMLTLGFSR